MRLIKLYKAALVEGENVVVECKALQEQVKIMEKSGWSRSARQAEKDLPKDEVKTPEVKTPEAKAPEAKAPEVKAQEVKAQEVKAKAKSLK